MKEEDIASVMEWKSTTQRVLGFVRGLAADQILKGWDSPATQEAIRPLCKAITQYDNWLEKHGQKEAT